MYISVFQNLSCVYLSITVDMRKVIIILLVVILSHSTSGQQYPNCSSCGRDGEYDMFCIIV